MAEGASVASGGRVLELELELGAVPVGVCNWTSLQLLQPGWDGPRHQDWYWICVIGMTWLTRLREYRH